MVEENVVPHSVVSTWSKTSPSELLNIRWLLEVPEISYPSTKTCSLECGCLSLSLGASEACVLLTRVM